ncbi:peptidylprolyl isomerase [Gracilibacillus caseinilyticus]|uniref:Foldase protein PrsA n=1 Tax=Gracilibacillus caseinilyticus TaxID=2932256 RepID=A0ABY4EST2_9BACI|nr:peptidylprolyl isomerase [Gracilibacillus caseinilyticus]UOQ46802.1 peptidylprolyl isomerase [Gracilibacillus caseinilyticus]
MKKLLITAAFATSVFALSACSSDSETVVETGSGNINKEDFYEELKANSGEQVLQQMVLETILEDKYDVSDEEVNKEIETYKEQYGDQWESVLQQSGYADEDAFREDLKVNLLQEKAATEDIEVTDEEIQTRYDRMQTKLVASHILVDDEATANEVKEKLDNGEDFAALAEEYSTDTQSASNGGELAEFGVGDMVPAFEDAAYDMEVGEVSDPVQSDYGFHIIKLTDRVENEDVEPLEDVRDQIKREIAATKVDQAAVQAKIQELMDNAEIDVKIDEFKDLFATEEATSEEGSTTDDSSSEGESTEEDSSSEEGSTEDEASQDESSSSEDSSSEQSE